MKKVLILEDHAGAQRWLSDAVWLGFGDQVEISIAETIVQANDILDSQAFDLFIVDLHLPDGSGNECLIYARQLHPDMPTVVATIYSDDGHLFPALQAGAAGYLLKDDKKEAIASMLSGILNGVPPLSPDIARRLMSHFQSSARSSDQDSQEQVPHLTERETETLTYIVKGFSIRECAELMAISPHTVSGYVKDIYKKLQVSSRAEVASEAVRLGIVNH